MAKIHTTIPQVTREQLQWLAAAGYGTQSAVLQEAVSRLYREESTLVEAHSVAAEA